MSTLWLLLKKEFLIDFRQKYPIAGIVLYIFATIYISYLTFQGIISPTTWNSIFWIVLLFTFITGLAKSFVSEEKRSLYYYLVIPSGKLLTGKLVYYSLYGVFLVFIINLLFNIFLPFPSQSADISLFTANMCLGALGLSASLTMISSIASKTTNASTLMAVLGFPVIIPVLLLAVTNSRKILLGAQFQSIQGNLTYLVSLIVIIIAVSYILFPYSNRN
jgi:heme exporter protein B